MAEVTPATTEVTAADQPNLDIELAEEVIPTVNPTATAAETTEATKAKYTISSGVTSEADSQADGAFLRQLLDPQPESDSQSAYSVAVQRRQDAGRPIHAPLLQLNDGFLNGSTSAGLNAFLSTEVAVFLNNLPNVQSPFLQLLQQYVVAPPGTRGSTEELIKLMETEVPEVLKLICRNNVRNSDPMEFLENLIFSIGRLLSEDQQRAWKRQVNIKFNAKITCCKCNKSTKDAKSTLVLSLYVFDQNNQPVGSVRRALQVLKDMNEEHEVDKACTAGCGAKKTMKQSRFYDPPRVLILCFRKKNSKIEIDYEICLPHNEMIRYRLNSFVSRINDNRFYAAIVDEEQGVWICDQDQEPRQATVAEFNEAKDNGQIFLYKRLPRTHTRCECDFSLLLSDSNLNVLVLLAQENRPQALLKVNSRSLQTLPGSLIVGC